MCIRRIHEVLTNSNYKYLYKMAAYPNILNFRYVAPWPTKRYDLICQCKRPKIRRPVFFYHREHDILKSGKLWVLLS